MANGKEQGISNVLEATLISINYIESRLYGDNDLADIIELTEKPETLYLGLLALNSSLLDVIAESFNLTPQQILNNIRETTYGLTNGSIELDGEEE